MTFRRFAGIGSFSKDEGARLSNRFNKGPSFFPLLQSPACLHRSVTRRFLLSFSPHYLPFSPCTKEPDSRLVERNFFTWGCNSKFCAVYIYIYFSVNPLCLHDCTCKQRVPCKRLRQKIFVCISPYFCFF